jgi:hypothetical protein
MEADGRRLLAYGATALPVVQIGPRLFCGEERIAEAAAARLGAGSGLRSGHREA